MSMNRIDYVVIGIDFTEYFNNLDEETADELYDKHQDVDSYLEIIKDQSSYGKPVILGNVLFYTYTDDDTTDEVIELEVIQETILKVKEQIKNEFGFDSEPKLRIVTTWG